MISGGNRNPANADFAGSHGSGRVDDFTAQVCLDLANAQRNGALLAARTAEGVGGALLVPAVLAMLQTSFAPRDRARAISAYLGLMTIASAAGPIVGGWVVEYASWRLV